MITDIAGGFSEFLKIWNLAFIALGVAIGIVFGAIPGLNAIIGVALVLPFTFYMAPSTAMCLMIGLYKGGVYSGSIPAILLNIPGAPEAAATAADGHALASQGKAGKALRMSIHASFIGGIVSDLLLILVAAQLAKVALRVGPPEMFGLLVFALTIIGAVSGTSLAKGVIAGLFGLFVASIGMDVVTGVSRFTFGYFELSGGIPFLPMLMGMFALSEIFIQTERVATETGRINRVTSDDPRDSRLSWGEFKPCLPTIFRSSAIGALIGAIPGPGATTSAFVSYAMARHMSKHPEKMGKGSLEGVAAPDAGNNATCSATLIPLFTLGIPGSPIAAVIAGALMIHGINPGPLIFQNSATLVYGFYFGMVTASILVFVFGFLAIRYAVRAVEVPRTVLFPVITALCYAGTYANSSSVFDLGVMTAFGVLGYLMRKGGLSVPAFVIAFLLGPTMENAFKQALLIGDGSFQIFLTSPIAMGFFILTIISAFLVHRQRSRLKKLRF